MATFSPHAAPRLLGGRYQVREEVGAGGFGAVYRGWDVREKRTVAVKVLHSHLARESNYVSRFRREAKIARAIESSHVVRVLDAGSDGDTHFLISEFVEGVTLRRALQVSGPLPWRESVEITLQLLNAIAAAHDKGIIHRDIKPQNVFIAGDGTVKLGDFGIADAGASSDTFSVHTPLIGSPQYVAPEQIVGRKVDHRADLYSLGVVLYEMLTGQTPFEDEGAWWTVLNAHIHSDPQPLAIDSIPDEVSEVVQRCLAKSPDERYANAESVRSKLARAARLGDGGSRAAIVSSRNAGIDRPNPTAPCQRRLRRVSPFVLGATTFVLAFAVGLGIFVEDQNSRIASTGHLCISEEEIPALVISNTGGCNETNEGESSGIAGSGTSCKPEPQAEIMTESLGDKRTPEAIRTITQPPPSATNVSAPDNRTPQTDPTASTRPLAQTRVEPVAVASAIVPARALVAMRSTARYSGTIGIGGQPVANGAVLVARIGSQECGRAIVSGGRYSMTVNSANDRPGCGHDSATVTFGIDDVRLAPAGVWRPGVIQELDLSRPESLPPARFQGTILSGGRTRATNLVLEAMVGDTSCGAARVDASGRYSIDVLHWTARPGCGSAGSHVSFQVGSTALRPAGVFRSGTVTSWDISVP